MNRAGSITLLAGRIILALVFIFAAIPKIMDPISFAEAIENYRVFSGVPVKWTALILPMLELLIGLSLLLNIWLREQLILTAVLYLIFDVLIMQAVFRGLDIDCGCFGFGAEQAVSYLKILENFFLTLLAGASLYLSVRMKKKN